MGTLRNKLPLRYYITFQLNEKKKSLKDFLIFGLDRELSS